MVKDLLNENEMLKHQKMKKAVVTTSKAPAKPKGPLGGQDMGIEKTFEERVEEAIRLSEAAEQEFEAALNRGSLFSW